MNYKEARSLFKNGDVVFFSGGKKNLIRRAITWFTRGPHYHVGIAFWLTDGFHDKLMLAEAQPEGFRIINLSYYMDRDMTVFRCPVPWERIADRVVESAGIVPYDFVDLAAIGLHERFGVPIVSEITGPGDVCSVIVAKILEGAGHDVGDVMVSPQRLCERLTQRQLPAFVIAQ